MTPRKTIVSGLALLSLALASGVAFSQEPRSYLLLCKGGNNRVEMHSQMATLGTLPGVDNSNTARVTTAYVTLNFNRASRGASAGLSAGQCAWADRGVNANEPATLRLYFPGAWFVVTGSLAGNRVTYETRGNRTEAAKLRTLLNALQNSGDFQLQAYNNGRGQLIATRFGP